MKFGTGFLFVADGDACLQGPGTSVIGANRRLLPSSAASASERLYLRTRVDTVEVVATEERRPFGFHATLILEGGRTGGFGGGGVMWAVLVTGNSSAWRTGRAGRRGGEEVEADEGEGAAGGADG